METKEVKPNTTPTREEWASYCKTGSCYVTAVELEFHHLVRDPYDPDDLHKLAPTPTHASGISLDDRSNVLLWLEDESPAHAQWSAAESLFRRIEDEAAIEVTRVRAWAAIPYPIAQS